MHAKVKPYLAMILASLGCILLMTVGIFTRHTPRHPVTELETVTSRIPLGISAAEADALMGTPPDAVSRTRGTLMNSTIMLSADNSLAAQYGGPQLYTIRTWNRGEGHATVAVDQSGKVAGRWFWSDHQATGSSQLNLSQITRGINSFWRYLVG
ncbi:hypothetical protein [Gimesia sp.]|uniref:hypothetical protein n=1 Tax=Gimesia sp. TaxID=2024833 RepID=UPI000C4B04C2|nr:hypothetical protein [Gimesia sp.]MAX40475.1 hypothetical protein [Gimesia sp.]HBL48575.1 hypothetical protein [Planctomycetaceae bacterium]